MSKVTELPVSVIEENPQALRTTVDKESLAYQELKSGIADVGLLNPISVREFPKEDGTTGYRLVDGLHRLTAFQDLGLPNIAVNVVTIEESKLLVAQIIGNQHVKTTKTQYAQALKQLIQHEGLSLKEVSRKVNKSEKWVAEQLGLLELPDEVKKLVDEGKIVVNNALALRKVKDRLDEFLQAAMTEPSTTFVPRVELAVKEARTAALQGRKPNTEFAPAAKPRTPGEVKAAYSEAENTGSVAELRAMIETQGIADPVAAAIATLKWFLHLDPVSVAAQKAKYDAEQAAKAEAKAKREAEAKAKKDKAAADEVAKTLAG